MPDYEVMLWNYHRFPRGKSIWVDQAFDMGKYAFAADYIRLYALFNYGGIYLDSDVEVIKPFDKLLELPYFIGQEKTPSGIEAATIGFPPKHPLVKQLLDRYEARPFIKSDGSLDMEPIPYIIRRYIETQYVYNVISCKEDFSENTGFFNVFAADYFSPKRYDTGEIEITEHTYSIHHFSGSWLYKSNIVVRESVISDLKRKLHNSLLLRKQVVIVSNTEVDNSFCESFGIKNLSPLAKASLSESDFRRLCANPDFFEKDGLNFMLWDESISIPHTEKYIMAKIKGTDLVVHFWGYYSREQVLKQWNRGVELISNGYGVFLDAGFSSSIVRWTYYKICFLIDCGVKKIRL